MTVITLCTDFGSGDHEAGVLKGVIWKIAPHVKIVDLSHDIAPQDIFEAALLLWRAAPYFPDGTIHIAVVDPGVGTSRRGIAARLGSKYFIGPDNGLVTLLLQESEKNHDITEFIHLDKPEYWMPEVSSIFHGRDVFAPISAYLAMGTPLASLGSPINNPTRLDIPAPVRTSQGWEGRVIHVDHFGNLSTNIHAVHINSKKEVVIRIKGEEINGLVSTFGDSNPGTLVTLLDSSNSLAISIVNGSAAANLNASVGDKIEVRLGSS